MNVLLDDVRGHDEAHEHQKQYDNETQHNQTKHKELRRYRILLIIVSGWSIDAPRLWPSYGLQQLKC